MSDTLLGVIIGGAIAVLPNIITGLVKHFSNKRKNIASNKKLTYKKLHNYMFTVISEVEDKRLGLHNVDFYGFKKMEEECTALLLLNGTDEINDRFKRFVKNFKELEENRFDSYEQYLKNMKYYYLDICTIIRKTLKNKVDVKEQTND